MKQPDDYVAPLPANRSPENRIAWAVNDAGCVCSVIVVSADCRKLTGWRKQLADAANASEVPFISAIRALRDHYPLDPADIVWPEGQQFDADGRPLSVIEMQQSIAANGGVAVAATAEVTNPTEERAA